MVHSPPGLDAHLHGPRLWEEATKACRFNQLWLRVQARTPSLWGFPAKSWQTILLFSTSPAGSMALIRQGLFVAFVPHLTGFQPAAIHPSSLPCEFLHFFSIPRSRNVSVQKHRAKVHVRSKLQYSTYMSSILLTKTRGNWNGGAWVIYYYRYQ